MIRCGCLTFAVLAMLACAAVPARAQYSQSLFLEAARDPGRADTAKTARELAMGDVSAISGAAEEATVSPSTLTLRSGSDAVFSIGRFGYARRELTQTPRQLPPFDATRALSATSIVPVGYGAIAMRRSGWAVGGFFDATSRYSHAFQTQKAVMFTLALFPTFITESASGEASVNQSVARAGGSVAVGNKRAGAGASLYFVHLRHTIDAKTLVEVGSRTITNPVFTVRCCVDDTDRVGFDAWSTGLSLSGHVAPIEHLTLTARWRRDPRFTAIRQGLRESVKTSQTVELELADVFAAGAIARFGGTIIVGEVARHLYGGVFSPLGNMSDPNYLCAQFKVVHSDFCSGWNFPFHDTRDTTVLKAGVEQGIGVRRGRVLLRGGVSREPGYTLARDANDPSTRRGLDFPTPAVVTPFEPPREDFTWLSAGAAYAWHAAEIGVGFGRANDQLRVLVDFRISR